MERIVSENSYVRTDLAVCVEKFVPKLSGYLPKIFQEHFCYSDQSNFEIVVTSRDSKYAYMDKVDREGIEVLQN